MATATYGFFVDWNNDNLFTGTGEDISALVREATWTMGRDYASQLTGRWTSGLATLIVKNFDNRFNSFNSASPLYGNLVPGRKVRITMTVGASTVTMFSGFLDSIDAQPDQSGGYLATLRAVGSLAAVAQRTVNVTMSTNIATGAAVTEILDRIGWSSADRLLDTGQTTLGRWWIEGAQDALNALYDIGDDEMGLIRETKDGKIAFEDRHHRLKSDHLTVQATFSDASGSALSYDKIVQGDPIKEIFNIIKADVRIFSVDAVAVLWAIQDLSQSRDIVPGSSRTWWALFPNAQSAKGGIGVSAWTTPVSTTDFVANSASDGSGTNVTANVSIAVSKFDTTMKITLSNSGPQTAYIISLQARGAPVAEGIQVRVQSEDATSIAKYRERTYPLPAKHLPNSSIAQDYTDYVLSIYKDPIPVLTLEYLASKSTAYLSEAQTRDVSDMITIRANNQAGLGLNENFFVEGITHNVKPGGDHRVAYACSRSFALGTFWVLGYAALGTDTRLCY